VDGVDRKDAAVNGGRDEVVDELFAPALTAQVRDWFGSFRRSFPDMRIKLVQLVGDADTVVRRFTCSGIQRGEWRGHSPTGRRFEKRRRGLLLRFRSVWALEDTLHRFRQLGLEPSAAS
jgi:predicted ester cyclase